MEISPAHEKGITIVVVGDSGSGKSSLIHTAASGAFSKKVAQHVLPSTRLPDDMFPDRVPVTVIDTSVLQRNKLEEDLKRADAIVVTYAANDMLACDRLITYWLPELRQLKLVRVPVIVVSCMLDLKYGGKLRKVNYMSPMMHLFPEIDACIECSAHRHRQVREVFCYVQKAVLYPTSPLFDPEIRTLSAQFVNALKLIFTLCDHDKDGSLNDAELNGFQVKCFNTPLQPHQIARLKRVVQKRFAKGINGSNLTFDGFIYLHAFLIKEWRLEIVWTVLRKFGYNNDIRLDNPLSPLTKRAPDQSVELTDDAIGFLKGVFRGHDYSKDDVKRLFSAADCPWNEGPYKDAAPVSELGCLTVGGILSEWVLMTLLEPAKSVEYLKYLAYGGDASSAIRLTSRRRTDRKKRQSVRNVYQCFVFGPKRAGKSALLDAFLERPFSDEYHSSTSERYAVNVVAGPSGSTKFLVLREIPEGAVNELLSHSEALAACDVAIFVYDNSNDLSLKKTADLLVEVARFGETTRYEVPCLIVAAKADINAPARILDATQVSRDMGIRAQVPINVKSGLLNDIFGTIVSCAEHPHLIPRTGAWKSRRQCLGPVDRLPMHVPEDEPGWSPKFKVGLVEVSCACLANESNQI